MIGERYCGTCGAPRECELRRWQVWRGDKSTDQYAWMCRTCLNYAHQKPRGIWISAKKLLRAGVDLNSLPFVSEVFIDIDAQECARCRAVGPTDRHHWAPVALFADADSWPKSNLCRSCHMEWHRRVTPGLCWSDP